MRITFFKGKFKLAILATLSAVVLGCAALLCFNFLGANSEASGEIDKPTNSAAALADESAMTTTTINSSSYASNAEAWAAAIEQSSETNKVVFVLQSNWTADSGDAQYTTSFGSGQGFQYGALNIPSGNIVIDLNGHYLNRGLSSSPGYGYGGCIWAYGNLEIKDSVGGGYITGVYETYIGGAVYVYHSNFVLSGGTIYANGYADYSTVYVEDGSITITGGRIYGETYIRSLGSIGGSSGPAVVGDFCVGGSPTIEELGMASGIRMNVISSLSGADITFGSGVHDVLATKNYSVYNEGVDPSTIFSSSIDDPLSLYNDEVLVGRASNAFMWNMAVMDSSRTGEVQTCTLNEDWIADSNNKLGNGEGFSSGRLWVGYNSKVVLDLNGHTIDMNYTSSATGDRYVIDVRGELEIKDSAGGGKISGNPVTNGSYSCSKSCIYISSSATFTLTSGKLTGAGGATIYLGKGTCNINGGSVVNSGSTGTNSSKDCEVYMDTGAYSSDSSKLIINGGTLKKVSCDDYQNNIAVSGGTVTEIAGGSKTVTTITGGTIGKVIGKDIRISGSPIITESVDTSMLIKVTGSLAGASIQLASSTNGIITESYSKYNAGVDPVTIFKSASQVGVFDGEVVVGEYGNDAKWNATVQKSLGTSTVQTFTLTQDWVLSGTTSFGTGAGFSNGVIYVPAGANIILDLNGCTINKNQTTSSSYGIIEIADGGTLEITDGKSGGKITGANITNSTSRGAVHVGGTLNLNGGTLTGNKGYAVITGKNGSSTIVMNGGSITDNPSANSGINGYNITINGGTIGGSSLSQVSGGYASGYTFTMNGGTISGGTTGVSYAGTFNMTGGTIKSVTTGVKLTDYSSATFNMTGGTITGNTTGVDFKNGTFNLSGSAKIENNTTANVNIASGKTITVNGVLTSASVGVTLASTTGTFTNGYTFSKNNASYVALYFFSDAGKQITLSSGEATVSTGTAAAKTTLKWQVYINYKWTDVTEGSYTFTYETYSKTITSYVRAMDASNNTVTITEKKFNGSNCTSFLDVGTYSLLINGNYTNPSFTLIVAPQEISVYWSNTALYYNGNVQYPQATTSGLGSDASKVGFILDTSKAGTNAGGTYSVSVKGLTGEKAGNYILKSATTSKTYTILRAQLTKPTASGSFNYNGTEQTYSVGGYNGTYMTLGGTYAATNAGDYTVTVSIKDTNNYEWTDGSIAPVVINWSINKVHIFVAGISVANKEYDGTTAATVSTSGLKLIGIVDADKDDHDKLWITFTDGTEFDGSNVGLHSVTITGVALTGTSADNYILEADTVAGYAQIYQATVTISGVAANNKTYDGTTAVTFNYDDVTIDGVAVSAELEDLKAHLSAEGYFNNKNAGDNVAVSIISYKLGGDYAGNYYIDFANCEQSTTADISKAEIEVTLGKTEYTVTYGNALKITYSQNSPVKSESVTLALEYYDESNEKLGGVPTNAGTYLVKVVVDDSDPNLANYEVKTTGDGIISEATVTIEKATLTVTVEDLEIEYGDDKPENDDYTLIYSGWLNGDAASVEPSVTVNTTYEQGNDVGDYELTLTVGELTNYNIVVADENGSLWVVAKNVTVRIDNKTSVYGEDEVTLTSNGASEMNITLEKEEGSTVGKYIISGDWDNDNYYITFIEGVYEITPATLTVTANDKTITYGDEAANDGVTITGYVNGDDENVLIGSVAYRYTYTQYGNFGNYGIIPYGLKADNYEIVYVNGLLTVGKKAATVTVSNAASDITSVPANRADAAQKMKYVAGGTVNGDNLNVVLTIAGTTSEASLAWPSVGTYIVTGSAGNANYNVSFVYEGGARNGTYTVSQGTLIITANTLIISYGDSIEFSADLDEAVTVEGLSEGATLSSLIADRVVNGALTVGESTYTVGADIYDASGNRISYTVLPAGLTSTSYNIVFKPGKLIVEPKSITVTLDNKTSVYGEELKELTASATGLVNYDEAVNGSVVEFLGITGLAKAAGTDADNYAITATGSTNKNYRVTFINGAYTIEQYEVTVVWLSGNADETNFNYTYNGTAQAPVATFTMNGTEYRSDDASGYIEITGSGVNAGEYKAQAFLLNSNLKFASGTDATQIFNVAKKKLNVTWYAEQDDIGNASKAIVASSTLATPVEYAYKTRQPYAPVVVLEGILDKDNSANFYYVSGAQSAVSLTPYEAELHILNANYDVASADKKVYFVIVKSAPTGFGWYEDTDFATQITSLKKYTYNGEVQHPVAKALGNEEFVYTIYKITGDTEQRVISTIDVGSYKIEARPVNNNLQLSEAQTTFYFEIEAKVVSVVWSATSFEYNGSEQVPTAYYTDAQGQMVNLALNGDKGVNAGDYDISVTLDNDNYTFVVDGEQVKTVATTYAITAKDIQVTWKSEYTDDDGNFKWSVVYDNTDKNEVVTAVAEMLNAVEEVGLKMTVTYQANENDTPVEVSNIHDAGIYTLAIALAEDSPNYNVVDAQKSFRIEKKQLNVSAVNKEVNTGSLAPTLTATYDGFVEGESAESLGLDATKWLTTNYNLSSPYIAESEYTQDSDITKLETLTDLTEGGYKGYFIVLTDSEARIEELNELLHNYYWNFNYGRMIILAVNGDVSIILTQVYNGEDLLPAAMYKSGQNWIDLKVEVYTDDTYEEKVTNPEVKDAGEYYLLLKKYSEDGIILDGAEPEGNKHAGCVKKTFTITKRNVTVNIGDKSVVYGELTDANYADYLESLWSYASSDKLYQPLAGDELDIRLSVDLAFDAAGYATVLKDGDAVTGYSISGSWSKDETLRLNYNVVFVGSNGDTGELKVTEAEIIYKANETNGFNQILETDKANGNYILGLYTKKDGKYEHVDIVGNENASIKIYYSNIYDWSLYELTDNLPQDEPDTAWKESLCSAPAAADGNYYVNFKIEVANHKVHYGQWTVQVIAGKAYIRIVFSDKQFTLTYGEATPDGTELATKLYNEGYVSCLDLTEDMFVENIKNGNLTAKALTDDMAAGSYVIVFEGIEKLNPDWIITYKQDVNANDDTATNIGKFVVMKRQISISWDKTTFVYDGEAHFPKPSIDGWTRAEGTQNVNGATVYTFTNAELGKTLTLTVRTNGGDFTSIGSENVVIATVDDDNYALDSLNATRAVSIIGETPVPVDPGDPVEPNNPIAPIVKESGIPAWALWLLGIVAVLALLVIIILATKSKKTKSVGDDDGFYDDVDENS